MLNISNAIVSNGGDYTCNVTNAAGYATNMTTVYSELIKMLLSGEHFIPKVLYSLIYFFST